MDRGFGFTERLSTSSVSKVAVIFIGGKDDQEALAYAGRVVWHQSKCGRARRRDET